MRVSWIFAVSTSLAVLGWSPARAGPLLYGGLGGHSNGDSTNDGSLVIVDQTTGAVSVIGHPAGVDRLTGLAFGLSGTLFATTLPAGGFPPPPGPPGGSSLITINPNTGALVSTIGLVRDGGVPISIADLAVQPGTGVLYGIRGPTDELNGQGRLYTINTTTGAATPVGDTGAFFGSIAFAPDGTLYLSAADLDFQTGNQTGIALKTLNPANAAILSSVPTSDFFGALGIRPTDGVIFGGTGDEHQLFTVNPVTGAEALVGDTGRTFVGDLDFQAVPAPGTGALLAIGLLVLARARRQS
jgi:hypothetical protein